MAGSPEAARWGAHDCLSRDCLLACCRDRVVGLIVGRSVAEGESEILNLAVHPDFRRRGIGAQLVGAIRQRYTGRIFLEVRESNTAAREFYCRLGFVEVGLRRDYYSETGESAIVMKF